jgi:hypothetical protein
MTNLSIDPGIARAARIKAVEQGVSLSAVVQDFLEGVFIPGAPPPDQAREQLLAQVGREAVRIATELALVPGTASMVLSEPEEFDANGWAAEIKRHEQHEAALSAENTAMADRQRELERRLDDVSGHLQSWRQWAGQVCAALGITDPAQVVPWIRELRATHGSPLPPDKPAEDLAEQENPR